MKSYPVSGKHLLGRQLVLICILLAGFAGSFALYRFVQYTECRRISEEFTRRAAIRHALIGESLRGYEECVYNLRNLFANSDHVTPAEFRAATRDIRTRHLGIQAVQWAPAVTSARRAEVEAWARRSVHPDFAITELGPDKRPVPAAPRDVHHPILYTDPLDGNEPALGFDLTVAPSQADLARALNERTVIMTRKIRLVQEQPDSDRFGVIMASPVFRETDGREEFQGFVQIVFRVDDVLGLSWIHYPGSVMETLILDLSAPAGEDRFLYGRSAGTPGRAAPRELADLDPRHLQSFTLTIGGRNWGCYYAMPPGWMASQVSGTPWLVLGVGLVFTCVLGAYFHGMRRRADFVKQQVYERTAELRHTQDLLEADIVKRQATEAELRESRRQLDSLLGQMPGMAYRCRLTPKQAIPLFISRGSLEITGHPASELLSNRVYYPALIHPEDRRRHEEAVGKAVEQRSAYESEYRLHGRDRGLKWVLDRGQGIYDSEGGLLFVEGLAVDITRRKQAEAEKAALDRKLLESQKLESLGVLAGGIAHDFNNLLTSIVGHASIARLDLPSRSPILDHLRHIEAGAKQAAELCQQMLAYAGKGQFLIQRTNLQKLVRDTTPLLEHSISKRATLRFVFQDNSPDIQADATQIRQIIMNLVVNASDALSGRDGDITMETGRLGRDDPRLASAVLPPPPGTTDFAFLRVTDTGTGMTAGTIAKIFEPFFTTKFAGRGLGLAAVLGIVRSHHGSLLVESAPGIGSSFTLLLPAIAAETPVERASDSRPPLDPRARPLAGTVLLIDDEEAVRIVAHQMFATLGLKVLIAADGVEGVELFKRNLSDISLVLLDLTMPRMTGVETLHAIRALAPHLPVILMSGYNQSAVPDLATDAYVVFLQKPFSLQALRQQISRMLG